LCLLLLLLLLLQFIHCLAEAVQPPAQPQHFAQALTDLLAVLLGK
jgi:hypothetical protein